VPAPALDQFIARFGASKPDHAWLLVLLGMLNTMNMKTAINTNELFRNKTSSFFGARPDLL
jgi:hypothetical protein